MNIRKITDNLSLYCETEMEEYRCDTFWTKEPETIAWIESFDGEVFLDIGANIGIYSLYAASLYPDMEVYAMEPVNKNFIRIAENIELNGFKNIFPLNMAAGNKKGNVDLFIPKEEVGESGAQTRNPIDEYGKGFEPCEVQPVFQTTVDDLIFSVPFDYIKIDVDGHEQEIIYGMPKTIKNMKSMLIECNHDMFDLSVKIFDEGFTIDNEFNKHPDHSRIRRQKEGITAENVIFTRGPTV